MFLYKVDTLQIIANRRHLDIFLQLELEAGIVHVCYNSIPKESGFNTSVCTRVVCGRALLSYLRLQTGNSSVSP